MIALQARNPQLPDPSRQTAQFANMMNMARQQEAAQRQSALAQQQMAYNTTQEARAGETQASNMRKADLDYQITNMKRLRNLGVVVMQTEDPTSREAAYQSLVGMIGDADEQFGATLRQVAPTFNAQVLQALIMEADKFTDKTVPNASASVELADTGGVDSQGRPIPKGTGIQVTTGLKPSTRVIPTADAATPAPSTPTAPQPAQAGPVPVGGFGETRVAPDGGPLNEFQQDHIRRMKEGLGMTDTPASFTGNGMGAPAAAQMTPEVMSNIVKSAFDTGVMAQVDFDQLLATQSPQNKQALVDSFRRANITLQADAPSLADSGMGQQQMAANPVQTPQAGFAVMRGPTPQSRTANLDGDMSMMRNTEVQYQPLQRRDPNVSTAPAETPEQAGRRALLGRETPGEVYAKEKARAKAQREALLEAGPKPLTVPQEAKLRANITKDYKSARSTIDMMLNPVSGVVAAVNNVRKLSPDQKEAVTGYSGYLPTMYASTKSADTAIKNLKGKVTEMGKSVASLAGAIGQMAVQEWRIVSDMIASLDLEGMGAADLDNQLDIIEAQARRAVEVTRDAYENQYVEEFARYPGRFQLPDASAAAAPDAARRTPTKGAVDRNNPLLKSLLGAKR
jgi:hypothetical protein